MPDVMEILSKKQESAIIGAVPATSVSIPPIPKKEIPPIAAPILATLGRFADVTEIL
jgi:hypothetical protein